MSNSGTLSRILPSLFPRQWPIVDFAEIRKRSRILVIDDSDFPYVVLFKRDGYTIEKWDDVSDLTKLEDGYFDLILLDIQNVGKALSNEQGLGVLKHIHHSNPSQIVIAYSNSDWSLKYQDFFAIADASLAKTDDYVKFKRTVDSLLVRRFSIDFYIDRICKLVQTTEYDEPTIKRKLRKAILRHSPSTAKRFLSTITENKENIALALKTILTAIGLLKTLYP